MKARQLLMPVLTAVVYLAVMTAVESVLQPGYLVKSIIKLLLTAVLIAIACLIGRCKPQEAVFFHRMKPARALFILMGVMFLGVFLGFRLFAGFLDLTQIRESLMAKEHLTKENCLFVFAYIAIVNSFLEEAFFRGFLGHAFPERMRKPWGILFSALVFALYHIGIMNSWMNLGMLVLLTAGLAAVGAALQMICDRYDSIAASWLAHGCANLAINAIGWVLIWYY